MRSALERTAHLFCELFERLRTVGLADERACVLPLTQVELGDMLALSAVHINRTLMELRRNGLAMFRNQHLEILDHAGLRDIAAFDAGYLHITGRKKEIIVRGARNIYPGTIEALALRCDGVEKAAAS